MRRIQAQHWGFLHRVNFHTKGLRPFIVENLLEPFHVEDIRFVAIFYSWSRLDLGDCLGLWSSLANLLASSRFVSTFLLTPSRFMEPAERRGLLLPLEDPHLDKLYGLLA